MPRTLKILALALSSISVYSDGPGSYPYFCFLLSKILAVYCTVFIFYTMRGSGGGVVGVL